MLYLLLIFASSLLAAQDPYVPEFNQTSHTYSVGSDSIPYTAITGALPISLSGDVLAELFFIAYLVEDEPERPITFVFPGGPGGPCRSNVICTFGPRRLALPEEGASLLPPYKMIDNPESLLPYTDLVFVDPVTTGYSKFMSGVSDEKKDLFFSTDEDISSLSHFVETFISCFQKWDCPKYLSGISYGTIRSAGVAEYLMDRGIGVNGIILMACALDLSTLVGQRNYFLPDSLLIPTFAATAWYYGRFRPESSLEEVVDHARRFVYEEHVPFMLQPGRFSPDSQQLFYEKMSELIGLREDTVRRYLGRFDERLYTTEFMAHERKLIGGRDTRYIGDMSSIERYDIEDDPSYKDILGVTCAFNAYLQRELDTYRPFETYRLHMACSNWDYSTYDSIGFPDLIQRIRRTLVSNSSMRVFAGSGYYDCRTPFAATEFCFGHMDLPPSYTKNFQFEYYEAGHGFVFDLPSLKKLKTDLIRFYKK
jgi:carboxypeptidase C (cathepsin A)